jgi:hypothetical protein
MALVRPLGFLLAVLPLVALGGPPYTTDDPEPVEHRHWEVYLATQSAWQSGSGWSGTAPHVEANYGVVPDLQLHLLVPIAYDHPVGGPTSCGLGDVEVGMKVRFVQEGEWIPMVGTFPMLEIPTGSESRGLGSGTVRAFFPLWLQKSFGPWTTYGGAGFWINPGAGNRDYWFVGWQGQRRLGEAVTAGAEVFYDSPSQVGEPGRARFNVGAVVDLSELHHLLFSAGTAFGAPLAAQGYLAYQLTFGPRERPSTGGAAATAEPGGPAPLHPPGPDQGLSPPPR